MKDLTQIVVELTDERYHELLTEAESELKQHECFGCAEFDDCEKRKRMTRHMAIEMGHEKARQN